MAMNETGGLRIAKGWVHLADSRRPTQREVFPLLRAHLAGLECQGHLVIDYLSALLCAFYRRTASQLRFVFHDLLIINNKY